MEYLQRLLDKIDRFEFLIAGLIGAVVASWWHKDDLPDWRAGLVFLGTGAACSLYPTSMVSAYLNVTEPKIVAGIGFLLGMFGGSLLAAINRAIKAADLWVLYFEQRRLQRHAGFFTLLIFGVGAVVAGQYSGWNLGLSQGFGGMFLALLIIAVCTCFVTRR